MRPVGQVLSVSVRCSGDNCHCTTGRHLVGAVKRAFGLGSPRKYYNEARRSNSTICFGSILLSFCSVTVTCSNLANSDQYRWTDAVD